MARIDSQIAALQSADLGYLDKLANDLIQALGEFNVKRDGASARHALYAMRLMADGVSSISNATAWVD